MSYIKNAIRSNEKKILCWNLGCVRSAFEIVMELARWTSSSKCKNYEFICIIWSFPAEKFQNLIWYSQARRLEFVEESSSFRLQIIINCYRSSSNVIRMKEKRESSAHDGANSDTFPCKIECVNKFYVSFYFFMHGTLSLSMS
jgi:hypothetical protein